MATGETFTTDAPSLPRSTAITTWRTAALFVVGAELLVLYAPTVRWLFDRWTISVWQNAHGLFIPPLVAWLVRQELRRAPGLRMERGSPWGFLFLAPALTLQVLDAGLHTELLSAVSLVMALPGLALLFLGSARTKVIAFPLAFCAFALPIPLGVTESIHMVLRQITTAGSAAVLPLFSVPVFTEGTSLHFPRSTLNIVDACSGFSTLYAALGAACLAAYSITSTRRRLLVLTFAAPIAIASNIVRIVVLSLLVVWRGIGVLETFLHPMSGMMTFALALPLIFWIAGPARKAAAA